MHARSVRSGVHSVSRFRFSFAGAFSGFLNGLFHAARLIQRLDLVAPHGMVNGASFTIAGVLRRLARTGGQQYNNDQTSDYSVHAESPFPVG